MKVEIFLSELKGRVLKADGLTYGADCPSKAQEIEVFPEFPATDLECPVKCPEPSVISLECPAIEFMGKQY